MAQEGGKIRYSVSLSPDLVRRLKEQAATEAVALSTVLARIVHEYYGGAGKADCESHLEALRHKYKELEQQAEIEVDTLTRQLQQESERATQSAGLQAAQMKELQDELHTIKTRLVSLEQDVIDKDDQVQLLEQEKHAIKTQAEEELAAKDDDIQKLEEGVPELLRRIEQERASKETVATGLQRELDLTQMKVKTFEGQVVDLKGQIQDLKEDKHSLRKQLELVTLRLPAPKEGFWSRVFNRKKKEPEAHP